MSECLFCRMVRGEIPVDTVLDWDEVLAFRDINPQAPTHVLIIPKQHLDSLEQADADAQGTLGQLLLAAQQVARQEAVADRGYRVVINTGGEGGQEIGHLHVHVLGGRQMRWPPG